MNPFLGIKLDSWYMALIPFGGFLVLSSLFYSPDFTTQKELFVLGFGIFLIGLGEWKSQKYLLIEREASLFHPYLHMNFPVRKPDFISTLVLILGILAIIISLVSIFNIISI